MKDSNVVVALNRVLTEYYGTPCAFVEFEADVATEANYDLGILQGFLGSSVIFYANKLLGRSAKDVNRHAIHHIEQVTCEVNTFYKHTCFLLYGSKLRKKLLKAMLKHNGDE